MVCTVTRTVWLDFDKNHFSYRLEDGSANEMIQFPQVVALIGNDGRARLAGSFDNAALIDVLCTARSLGKIASVQVCTPMVAARAGGDMILGAMSYTGYAPSVGGWHEVTDGDLVSYQMAARPKQSSALLATHPCWRGLSFLRGLDPRSLAFIITKILDPRWFVDSEHPERHTRLRAFLGIDPLFIREVQKQPPTKDDCARKKRCAATLACVLPRERPSDEELASDSGWYFVRRLLEHMDRPVEMSMAVTARHFVDFLCMVWLDELRRRAGSKQEHFVPEYFFRDAETALAYRLYEETFDAAG